MNAIEFSKYKSGARSYGGSDDKRCIFMDDKFYMVKLPNEIPTPNSLQTSVSNNVISEYIGSHIMQSLGLETQNTLLGLWEGQVVVACEDFKQRGQELHEFSWYMQDVIPKSQIGRIPTYKQLYKTFYECSLLRPVSQEGIERYWDTIIGDALLGNFDRHKDNFGFLVEENEHIQLAPIYDCGSCLYPALSENKFNQILSNLDEIQKRIYQFPKIALNRNENKNNEDKFGYLELLSSNYDEECTKALFALYPHIDIDKICSIVENTPFISDTRIRFYETMLQYRKELIIDTAYETLLSKDEIKRNKDIYFSRCDNSGSNPTEWEIS